MRVCLVFLVFLTVACGAPIVRESFDGDFVATETADDVEPRPVTPEPDKPPEGAHGALSADEEAEAALLVHQLARAETAPERDEILARMIDLGPRYLDFLRSIDDERVLLDLMYVIRRIHIQSQDSPSNPPVANPDTEPSPYTIRTPDHEPPRYDDEADFDREQVENFLRYRLAHAKRLLDTGRAEEARRIAEAAIILLPDSRYRAEFDGLILRAHGESQAELLIAGTLTLNPEAVRYARAERGAPFSSMAEIRCYLKNVSGRPLTLRLYEGPGRESLLVLQVTLQQLDFQGNTLSVESRVSIPIRTGQTGQSVTIAPGETYELAVELEGLSSLDPDAPLKRALGQADIEASLRVFGANDAGGRPLVLRPVRFPAQSLKIFPADFDLEAVRERPIPFMREQIRTSRPQDLYLSSQLVERRQRRHAGDLLLGEDFESGAVSMQRARLRAMHSLFGVGAAWDVQRWRQWWRENRLRH